MKPYRSLLFRLPYLTLFLIFAIVVHAQNDECEIDVELLLSTLNENCDEVGRNQVCYGNHEVNALASEGFGAAQL